MSYYYNPVVPAFLTNNQKPEAMALTNAYQTEYHERYGEISYNADMDGFKAAVAGVALISLTILAATLLGVSTVAEAYKASGIVGICTVGTTMAICAIIKFAKTSNRHYDQIPQLNNLMAVEYQMRLNDPKKYPLGQPIGEVLQAEKPAPVTVMVVSGQTTDAA